MPLKTRFANPSNPYGSRIFAQTLLEKRRKIATIGQVCQFAPANAHPISILTPCPLTVVFPHSPFEGAEAGLDLSRAGVFKGLSKELKETGTYGILLDEKWVEFDNLRGDKGASGRFYDFLNRQNLGEDVYASVDAIRGHSAAATDIHSSLARVWMGRQREWATKSLEEHLGAKNGRTELEQYAEMTKQGKTFKGMLADVLERPTYDRAMTYQHAFTYGILTRVKVGNRTKDGRIILARTESKEALKTNGFIVISV
jgi:hypothetical protein